MPEVIFSLDIFSFNLINIELNIENIHFIFLADFKENKASIFPGCFLCFKEKENSQAKLILKNVYIESLSNSSIIINQTKEMLFSFIYIDGYI